MRTLILFLLCLLPTLFNGQTYKIQNYHNQLRLNTKTGEVQQIQDDGQSWEICSAREI